MLVGAGDLALSAIASGDPAALAASALGALLLVPLGLPLGLAAWGVEELLLRRGVLPWLASRLCDPSTRWHVPLTAAVVIGVALAAALQGAYVRAALALQDDGYAARLSSFVLVLSLVALASLLPVLAGLLRWVAERAAAHLSQRARDVASRLGLGLGWLLAVVWLSTFLARDAQLMGPLAVAPYGVLLGLVLVGLRLSPLSARVSSLAERRGFWLGLALAFCAAALLSSAVRSGSAAVARSRGPAAASALFARLTDVDGDGQSGLFGGADCAPFDAKRGPFAFDSPGNGLDEDCDGRDARASKRPAGALAAARPEVALPAALVRRYNVVLIVVDALRADRVGRARTLTPELDRLAREGVSFTRAYAQGPSTRISFPSFLSGLWPANVRFENRGGLYQMSAKQPSLATTLRALGYHTAIVINGWMQNHLSGVRHGYDRTLSIRTVQGQSIDRHFTGPSSSARGIEAVESAARDPSRPFFLTLYYDGPHAPYDDLREFGFPARSGKPADRYDAEIRYVDAQVGHFIDHLRMKPALWANTVVVVTADHGEELGEHGGAFHDRTCYTESTHVPLIVRAPGIAPAVAQARVALVDIAPTIFALVGARPTQPLDGRNLLRASADRYAHEPDARTFCNFFLDRDPLRTQLVAVRDERWLAIRRVASGETELYDTKLDPGEAKNLAQDGANSALLQRYRGLLEPLPFLADKRRRGPSAAH